MTIRDKQRLITDKLSDTRRMIQKNLRELVDKVAIGKNVEHQIKTLQANIDKAFKLTLLGLNVATRDQIAYLDKKIDIVNQKVDVLAAGVKNAEPVKAKKEKKKKKAGGKKKRAE